MAGDWIKLAKSASYAVNMAHVTDVEVVNHLDGTKAVLHFAATSGSIYRSIRLSDDSDVANVRSWIDAHCTE